MLDILSPGSFRGYRSRPHPIAVPAGFFSDSQNLRWESGALSLRGGQSAIASGPGSGTFLGGTFVSAGDNVVRLFAMNVSGTVRLYYQVYNGSSWGSATEATASSGKYGNTRMSPPTSGYVTFTPVWSEYGQLDVLAQNGIDAPRLWNFNNTYTAKVESITAPKELSAFSPRFSAKGNLNITAASTATNSTGARFAASTTGTPQYWLWTFTTPTVGDTAEMVCDAVTVDCSSSNQVWLIAESSEDSVFDNCKIEINQGGTRYTVHDPQNGKDNLVKVPTQDSNIWVYGLPVGDHAAGNNINAVKGLRFTVQNAGITAGATLKVYSVCASGRVPGLAQYAVSWRNSGSRAESPSVVLPLNPEADGVTGIWGATLSPLPAEFRLPFSELLDYQVSVPVMAPTSSMRDSGVDYIDVWRKDPGEDGFYYVYESQAATYSGSWAYTGSYTSTALRGDYSDNLPTWAKSSIKRAPDAYNEPVPIGQAASFAAGRLYVGSSTGSSHTSALLMVSHRDFPYRFRRIADPEDTGSSGFSAKLSSGERITAFAATSGDQRGPVYCFTDKGVWAVNPPLVYKVSEPGCFSCTGASSFGGSVYYVSTDATLRRISSAGNEDLSRYKVDDLDSADLSKTTVCGHQDRVFVSFNDGTDKVLVYNLALGEFEGYDLPGEGAKQILPYQFGGVNWIVSTASDGDFFRYGYGTLDGATQIPFILAPGEISGPGFERTKVGGSNLFCTDKDGEVLSVSYQASKPASTVTGLVSLDSSGSESKVWRRDKTSSGTDAAVGGASVYVSLSGTIAGPFTIFGWTVDVRTRAGTGQDNKAS